MAKGEHVGMYLVFSWGVIIATIAMGARYLIPVFRELLK